MIELGRKAKDEITGFTGVITGKSEFKIGDKVRFSKEIYCSIEEISDLDYIDRVCEILEINLNFDRPYRIKLIAHENDGDKHECCVINGCINQISDLRICHYHLHKDYWVGPKECIITYETPR